MNSNPPNFSNSSDKTILEIFKWIFFASSLVFAMAAATTSILASFLFLLTSLLIFPVLKNFWIKFFPFLKHRAFKLLCLFMIAIAGFVVFGISNPRKVRTPIEKSNEDTQATISTQSNDADNVVTTKPNGIGIGDVLQTEYFDITVNKVRVVNEVNTGNQFADLKAEDGNKYLIINATFKNTDNESRMLFDGTVWITYNGKEYEFDKSEVVMLDGWGLLLDEINPLTKKTTKLVYKIPAEITGKAYWQPGRASESERVFVGELN